MTNEAIFKTDDPQLALLFAQVQADYLSQGDIIVPSEEDKKVAKPKDEKPKVEKPKVEKPKVEKPKVEKPKVEKPKATKKGSKLRTKKAEIPYKVGDKVEFLIDGDWNTPSVITEIKDSGDIYVFTIVTEEDGEEFTVDIDKEFSEVRLIEKK